METITHAFHWTRLRGSFAVPAWIAIGWGLIEALHTLGYIGDHLNWFATPKGNLFVILFGFIWLFAVALWPSHAAEKQNPIDGEKFASFMRRGRELNDRLASIQAAAELPGIQIDIREWVNQTIAFLRESNCHTEAEVFSQVSGLQPSPEEMAKVADFPEWKRYDLAQLSIYRHRLVIDHLKT